jgi:hypothetical protein
MLIPLEQPALFRMMSQRAKDGLGPAASGAVYFHEVHGGIEFLGGHTREEIGQSAILKWQVVDLTSR